MIVKFIIVIIITGTLANLLTVGVKASHYLLHVDIHGCIIKHIVVVVNRTGVTAQTFCVSFIAAFKFTLTKGFPVLVFKNLWCVLSQIFLFDPFLNQICQLYNESHVAVSDFAIRLESVI